MYYIKIVRHITELKYLVTDPEDEAHDNAAYLGYLDGEVLDVTVSQAFETEEAALEDINSYTQGR